MKYTPTNGKFSGQMGYGYRSFEMFIDAVQQVNCGNAVAEDYEEDLASIASTYRTTGTPSTYRNPCLDLTAIVTS